MKTNTILVTIFLIISLTSCYSSADLSKIPTVQTTISPSQSILEYFPLKKGAYWVYYGDVKWTVPNSTDRLEEKITWKMEVERVFQRNNIFGYEMQGAPWDLAWYEKGKQPSKYGIIQAGGKFYQTSIETVWRLMDDSDTLAALIDEKEIFLDTPLVSGKKFCDADSLARPDGMYCWSVGDATQADMTNITGVNSSVNLVEFPIHNATLPDYSMIQFIPGIGITRFVYEHHGTVSDVDVKLIEFHAGN